MTRRKVLASILSFLGLGGLVKAAEQKPQEMTIDALGEAVKYYFSHAHEVKSFPFKSGAAMTELGLPIISLWGKAVDDNLGKILKASGGKLLISVIDVDTYTPPSYFGGKECTWQPESQK